MAYTSPNTRIDHSQGTIPLRRMFLRLEEWLCLHGLEAGAPPGTKPTAKVSTTSFVLLTGGNKRVLCSLQYLPQGGWLQFHWYKDVLEQLGRLEQFKSARARIMPLTAKYRLTSGSDVQDEVENEYRINLRAEDQTNLDQIMGILEPILTPV